MSKEWRKEESAGILSRSRWMLMMVLSLVRLPRVAFYSGVTLKNLEMDAKHVEMQKINSPNSMTALRTEMSRRRRMQTVSLLL